MLHLICKSNVPPSDYIIYFCTIICILTMHKMLFRSENFLKIDAWEAVIFLQA